MRFLLLHVLITAGITLAARARRRRSASPATATRPPRSCASAWLCHAPALDWLVIYFTVLPLIVGPILAGWAGLLGAIIGQVASVQVWIAIHEWVNRDAVRGPRIVTVINRLVGRWRNHTAIWATAVVTPLFSLVRLAEVLVYPVLTRMVRLPAYDSRDWVSVSRRQVPWPGRPRPDLVPLLRLDDRRLVAGLGDAQERRILLVSHPFCQRQKMRQLPPRLPRR